MIVHVQINVNPNLATPKIAISMAPKNDNIDIRIDVCHTLEIMGMVDVLASSWILKTPVSDIKIADNPLVGDKLRKIIRELFPLDGVIKVPESTVVFTSDAVLATKENIDKLRYNLSKNPTAPNKYSKKERIINYVRNIIPGNYPDDEYYALYEMVNKNA